MKNYKIRKRKLTIILIALLLFISIGYAALTSVLKINGHVALGEASFNIHFDNIEPVANKANIINAAHFEDDETKTEIAFDVELPRINDYYRFTTDIVNEGTIPGKIKSIEYNGVSESQKKLLHFRAYYTTSKKDVAIGDFIGPESSKNITVELLYDLDDDVTDEDLLTDGLELDCSFIIHFENGDMTEYLSRAASNRLMQQTDFFPTSFVNFTKATSSDEHLGIYRLDGTEEDDFPIYFYRGNNANINNHVNFGGYCWRIIRTTNTGGIKIIYNGTPNGDGQCTTLTGANTQITSHNFGNNNNYASSSLKTWLATWYFEHLINYQTYLEDTPFCNDKNYSNGNISLDCEDQYVISMAKGTNNYPIGFISAKEANLCGQSTGGSTFGWLNTGYQYWTISGGTSNTDVWFVSNSNGMIYNSTFTSGGTVQASLGVRPVVSLNSEVVLSGGDGSTTNPYTVSLG